MGIKLAEHVDGKQENYVGRKIKMGHPGGQRKRGGPK